MILFCLPHAGGYSNMFCKWKNYIDNSIKLYPIELAGRGSRTEEKFYDSIEQGVYDIYRIIESTVNSEEEYSLFGHSMGSLLAYEVAHKIQKEGFKAPKHIFFSGYGAPHIKKREKPIHCLPDKEFKEELPKIGGMPGDVMKNEEIMSYVMPILRSDFKLVYDYEYKHEGEKLYCDITVFNGKDDDLKLNEIFDWKIHTWGKCTIYMFEGNHFFINDNLSDLCLIINNTLLK